MNRRECLGVLYDLQHGVRWWVDFGQGDEELTVEKLDGRAGILRAYCPL